MASIKILTYQVLQVSALNPGLIVGDVIDVYADDTLLLVPAFIEITGLSAYKNGVLMVTTDAMGDQSPSVVSIQEYNITFCSGTYLFQFFPFVVAPYGFYWTVADSLSCILNPPTCDLIVVGFPLVVGASDTLVSDGEFTINATSTNPIQYKIGSNFIYNDGTGQDSPTFSAMLPGTYLVFLRDSVNCFTSTQVVVPVGNTYGIRFRLEYDDLNGDVTRIDLVKRNYTDPLVEACGSDEAFRIDLRAEGEDDKLKSLVALSAVLSFTSLTDGVYSEIYTNDPNLYRLNYYKNLGIIRPASNPFSSIPFSGWTNEAGSGNNWTTGVNPFVLSGSSFTDNLISAFSGITEPGTYDFTFDVNSTGNAAITVSFYKSGVEISGGSLNSLAVFSGNNVNTFPVVLSSVPDQVKVKSIRVGIVDRTVTLNSFSLDVPEISGFQQKNTFKVLPQLYQSAYKAAPYYVSINATDGLSELKDNFLVQTNGQIYYGTISLIKLIAQCLSVIRLDLDILVACNLYAVESSNILEPSVAMLNTDSDDPLDQAYIDFEAFYLAKESPDFDFVLKSILDAFGCRIIQSDNRWNIIRIEEMVGDIDYRLFDLNGNYKSNGTINVVSEIKFPSSADELLFVGGGQSFEIKPGYGNVRVIYNMGLKPNVLKNGDFRLKLFPVAIPNGNISYIPQIDFTGWLLVNPGYALSETYEQIDDNNIAYKIMGDASMINTIYPIPYLPNWIGGNAYIQSDEYYVTMASNDSFLVSVNVKIISTWQSNFLIGQPFKIEVPYVRVRFSVTCDGYWLNGDGTWSSSESIMSFFTTDFDKYVDFQVTANKPPTNGLLSVRVYHAYIYYAGYYQISDVQAIDTYDSFNSVQTTPTGFKLEIREDSAYDKIHYYELQENTDAPSGYSIIRPTDYNAGVNPRQWVQVDQISIDDGLPPYSFGMCIDRVSLSFLTNGKAPFDKIIRTKKAEAQNRMLFEKELFIGSYSTLITTETSFGLIGATLGNIYGGGGSLSITTTSQLNSELVYAAWLRSSTGEGYRFWKRDGISEEDYLHGLLLKTMAGQYKKSWRVMNASFYARTYFRFINVLKEVNDNNTLYLPMSLSLDDKRCQLSGEVYELTNIYGNSGSDGSGESPFTSGFTTGFGASSFN